MFIIVFILNWTLKLFMAWLAYLFATWLQLPEWAVMALVAIGAAESHVKIN